MNVFIGVDLGWYGKPTGLASNVLRSDGLHLRNLSRIEDVDEILAWITAEAGRGSCVIAIDAPTVIRNETGIRPSERALNHDFRRFHAGCHPANLSRPFAQYVIRFSRRLAARGFKHGDTLEPKQAGRFQIEVHPHAATVSLFALDRIVKYKRGTRAQKAAGLDRLRSLLLTRLPLLNPALTLQLPEIPGQGKTKPVEDQIDAAMCAYIAAHWWFWGKSRNTVYGDSRSGYVVVPKLG